MLDQVLEGQMARGNGTGQTCATSLQANEEEKHLGERGSDEWLLDAGPLAYELGGGAASVFSALGKDSDRAALHYS